LQPLPVARALRFAPPMNAPPLAHPVRFANLGREAACRAGETLFQSARRAGIRIVGACGGRGACGTCLVRVVSGEYETVGDARADGWLRACKLVPLGPCTVEVAPRSAARIVRTEVGGRAAPLDFDPAVRVHDLALTPPTLDDPQADADRLLASLSIPAIDSALLRELPALLRKHCWTVRAVSRGAEVIAVSSPAARALGLAVDLGTTNAAGFLVDLQTGERLGTLGIENPQAPYGADVVSRVNHAIRASGGAGELRAAAGVAVRELALFVLRRNDCRELDVGRRQILLRRFQARLQVRDHRIERRAKRNHEAESVLAVAAAQHVAFPEARENLPHHVRERADLSPLREIAGTPSGIAVEPEQQIGDVVRGEMNDSVSEPWALPPFDVKMRVHPFRPPSLHAFAEQPRRGNGADGGHPAMTD